MNLDTKCRNALSPGLELAIKYAKTNPIKSKGRTNISRMAAVLTDGYRTFIGFNSYKSHPLQARFSKRVGEEHKIHVHAEVSVLAKALKEWNPYFNTSNLDGFTLYIARVLKDGTPALAKPCPGCLAAITEFNIKHVEYTT